MPCLSSNCPVYYNHSTCIESKEELKERIYKYFEEVNREPVVYRWKYRLEDEDVSKDVVVDTLPLKQSS